MAYVLASGCRQGRTRWPELDPNGGTGARSVLRSARSLFPSGSGPSKPCFLA